MKTILITNDKNNINYKNLKKIIIGEWCFNDYTKEKNSEKYKFLVKNIIDRKKYIKDNLIIEKKILKKIIPILNNFHQEKKSIRQWQVILGHWLRSYIGVFSNRYKHINYILNKEKIDNFIMIKSSTKLYSRDIKDFLDNVRTTQFNDDIYKSVLKYNNSNTIIKSKIINLKRKKVGNIKSNIKIKILRFINLFFSKNYKFFISELYLGKFKEVLFHLNFNNIPRFWNFIKFYNYTKPNENLRNKISNKILSLKRKNLENFLIKNLFLHIPTAYLEDYKKIKKFCTEVYPKDPKAIITANTFYYNEAIKNYISQKLNKSKYIIIQHGNNYGTHFDEHYNSVEEVTSDYFITWGFLKKNKKYLKGVMQKKMIKNKNNKYNLLIMHLPFELRDKIWDNFEDYYAHMKKIEKMLIKIKLVNGIKKIIYRIPNGEHNIKSIQYIKKISKKITFDTYKTKLLDNIENSNLCLFNYNSSGFYENLSNNIPSILFIDKSYLNEIDSVTRKDFLKLHKYNIIHFEIETLYNFLNSNWENLDSWWSDEGTQDAKNVFVNNNAISDKNPLKILTNVIKKITK